MQSTKENENKFVPINLQVLKLSSLQQIIKNQDNNF